VQVVGCVLSTILADVSWLLFGLSTLEAFTVDSVRLYYSHCVLQAITSLSMLLVHLLLRKDARLTYTRCCGPDKEIPPISSDQPCLDTNTTTVPAPGGKEVQCAVPCVDDVTPVSRGVPYLTSSGTPAEGRYTPCRASAMSVLPCSPKRYLESYSTHSENQTLDPRYSTVNDKDYMSSYSTTTLPLGTRTSNMKTALNRSIGEEDRARWCSSGSHSRHPSANSSPSNNNIPHIRVVERVEHPFSSSFSRGRGHSKEVIIHSNV